VSATYATRAAGAQANTAGRRAAVIAGLPRHLRMLAHYTERLSPRNPETFAASKDEIVKTLESLAVVIELERAPRVVPLRRP
jgi:hypothetical protein